VSDSREAALTVCRRLTEAGHRALFAGGCVRDELLGNHPQDHDVATSAKPDEVEDLFDRVVTVGKAFGVQVVQIGAVNIEVATFRWDGPYLDGRRPVTVEFRDEQQDAMRRDFTVNALFYDPIKGEVLDYAGGREDLARRTIRAVGVARDRFMEDHLRLLRCVRFAAQLDFQIDPETFAAVKELAHLIKKTSPERVRDELLRILTQAHVHRGFMLLDESGLLPHLLPEISAMKGVEQPPEYHPEGDVFVHTMKMLDLLDTASPTLALGVLLHDVGKPRTQTFEDRIRFNGHEKVGAEMAAEICARLRLSNAESDRVVWLVGQHMRVSAVKEMRESKLKRLIREDGFLELLELFRIDCASSHRRMDTYEWLQDRAAKLGPEEIRPTPLVTGDDLIALGYAPGPIFTDILRTVEDLQLEGALTTREQAVEHVKKTWPK
jgi:poly(A) polymerase